MFWDRVEGMNICGANDEKVDERKELEGEKRTEEQKEDEKKIENANARTCTFLLRSDQPAQARQSDCCSAFWNVGSRWRSVENLESRAFIRGVSGCVIWSGCFARPWMSLSLVTVAIFKKMNVHVIVKTGQTKAKPYFRTESVTGEY